MRALRSEQRVTAIVLALYGAWIGVFLLAGHEPRDFIKIGPHFVRLSHASKRIHFDPTYRYPRNHDPTARDLGYDGQFSYFMALDFTNARYYMDKPVYRYSRVLYPLAARALALDSPGAVPVTLILVNWLAVGAGTFALARWLRRRRTSVWWAAGFALYPGLFLGVQRDLTEPLAVSLVAVALCALDGQSRHRALTAGVLFGLAGLARQTTILFPLCWGLAAWWRGDRSEARAILALGILPIAIYSGYLAAWLGPAKSYPLLQPIPFRGLFEGGWRLSEQPPNLFFVVLPALLFTYAVILSIRELGWRVEHAGFLLNALLLVALVPPGLYGAWTALGRQSSAVVLAAVLCVPLLRSLSYKLRRPALAAAALWMALAPVVAVYGFTTISV